jgi:hypothetical protein
MSDLEHERTESSSGVTWATSIIGTLLVYALSVGPVAKISIMLYGSTPPPAFIETVQVIYAPLALAMEFRTCADFYDWYFKLWGLK